jgi:hypothetical protein
MAITAKSEEIVVEVARAAGDIYAAINDGIGTETVPGTALFEIRNLEKLATNSLPYFGTLETSPVSFELSYDEVNDPYFVTVGSGQIAFNGARVAILAQRTPLRREFAQVYPSDYQYGIRLGLPIEEARRATRSYSTTVSQNTSSGATEVPIVDTTIPEKLGFPLQAYIGSTFMIFSGMNAAKTALVIDAGFNTGSYGTLPFDVFINTPVRFLYEPRIRAVCGLPQEGVGNDPADFTYYPPLPKNWLPIADILVTNPADPAVSGMRSTIIAWPTSDSSTPVFDSEDSALIASSAASTRQTLRSVRDSANVSGLIQAIRTYTSKKADNPQTSFRQFWSKQPFRPTSYFGRGISFAGLERAEFSTSFAKAYYDLYNEDIQHTFAIFRGDLVSQTNIAVGLTNVSGLSGTSLLAKSESSSLPRGTYIYGVSAVLPAGETPPTYASILAESSTPTYFLNSLEWNSVPSALFYHVYRRSNIAGELTEQRLTTAEEINGSPKFTNSPVSVSQVDTISTSYYAIKVVPASGAFLGGVSLMLKASAVITNPNNNIVVTLHSDTAGAPGATLATATSIAYGDLTAELTEFTPVFNIPVTPGSTYWLRISRVTAPTGGNIQIAVNTAGTNQVYTSPDATTWSAVSSRTAYFKLRGWIDRGVVSQYPIQRGIKLTSRISLTPRRLSVLVPEIDTLPDTGLTPKYANIGDDLVTATESTLTQNDMVVSVTARKGESGTPVTLSVTVPKGTVRGTRLLLGTSNQLFDRVDNVSVQPGANLTLTPNGQISWSVYDFVTVETAP